MHASEKKLSKKLKNDIETLVGHTIFKLCTIKIIFWSITQDAQELFGLL